MGLLGAGERKQYRLQTMQVHYLHLAPNSPLPACPFREPFSTVIIINSSVTGEWRNEVSKWLVDNGCLYMMAWGIDCSLWDDSVDSANLAAFNFAEIPDDSFVMTTWHDKEPLEDVLWFALHAADHPTVKLDQLLLIDISRKDRQTEILEELSRSEDLQIRRFEQS